ncbi:hypothetical protein PVAP13_7NG415701, partial [Panicum virgatum]
KQPARSKLSCPKRKETGDDSAREQFPSIRRLPPGPSETERETEGAERRGRQATPLHSTPPHPTPLPPLLPLRRAQAKPPPRPLVPSSRRPGGSRTLDSSPRPASDLDSPLVSIPRGIQLPPPRSNP